MFERKIEKELYEWKKSLQFKKKAFVLKGLRQVGKTFIIKKFSKENYENVIYINFKTWDEIADSMGYKNVANFATLFADKYRKCILHNIRYGGYYSILVFA